MDVDVSKNKLVLTHSRMSLDIHFHHWSMNLELAVPINRYIDHTDPEVGEKSGCSWPISSIYIYEYLYAF